MNRVHVQLRWSVEPDGDGWVAKVFMCEDGKEDRGYHSATFATKDEAQAALDKMRAKTFGVVEQFEARN